MGMFAVSVSLSAYTHSSLHIHTPNPIQAIDYCAIASVLRRNSIQPGGFLSPIPQPECVKTKDPSGLRSQNTRQTRPGGLNCIPFSRAYLFSPCTPASSASGVFSLASPFCTGLRPILASQLSALCTVPSTTVVI
jgi:hypothetical protein